MGLSSIPSGNNPPRGFVSCTDFTLLLLMGICEEMERKWKFRFITMVVVTDMITRVDDMLLFLGMGLVVYLVVKRMWEKEKTVSWVY